MTPKALMLAFSAASMMTKEPGPLHSVFPAPFPACPLLHLNQITPHLLQVPAGPVFVLSLEHCTPGSFRAQMAPQTTGLACGVGERAGAEGAQGAMRTSRVPKTHNRSSPGSWFSLLPSITLSCAQHRWGSTWGRAGTSFGGRLPPVSSSPATHQL